MHRCWSIIIICICIIYLHQIIVKIKFQLAVCAVEYVKCLVLEKEEINGSKGAHHKEMYLGYLMQLTCVSVTAAL